MIDAALETELGFLREIRDELRGLRADLRHFCQNGQKSPALIEALRDEFDAARFTARGLLDLAANDPRGALAAALDDLVDLSLPDHAAATSLGRLLSGMAEVVAEARGIRFYKLRE